MAEEYGRHADLIESRAAESCWNRTPTTHLPGLEPIFAREVLSDMKIREKQHAGPAGREVVSLVISGMLRHRRLRRARESV